jgi:glycosyltransferase involved in cell wall biosynthesis
VELIKAQKQHLESFSYENMKRRLAEFLKRHSKLDLESQILNQVQDDTPRHSNPTTRHSKLDLESNYQIQGPFDSSYSLAIVNKTIAQALDKNTPSTVALYSTEGGGDFEANLENLDENTKALAKSRLENVDVTIRNLYPPRTNAMKGYHKIIGPYGWEESKFPAQYVEWFNQKSTLIFTMSNYVTNLLKDNGVYTPLKTIGLVVEDILKVKSKPLNYELPTNFKLLHISSAFERKGLDKLLVAFDELILPNQILNQVQDDKTPHQILNQVQDDTSRHSKLDLESNYNISLIIKTFPNPHNKTIEQIQNLGFELSESYEENATLYTKNTKKILLINKDIPQENIKYLYENSNLLIAPSFGEGFGLPMAEAMLLDLPVLTTGFGGQSDFCSQETSWLLDFDFEYAHSHMNLNSSLWAVPKNIKKSIESFYHLDKGEVALKTLKAKEFILKHYSSKQIATNIQNAIDTYPKIKPTNKIALFSSYNTRCGIAIYAKHLISSFNAEVTILANKTEDKLLSCDSSNTLRCWEEGRDTKDIDALKEQLLKSKITRLIIQYNFSFIPLHLLAELLNFCKENSIQTHLFLHSTKDVTQPTYTDSFSTITAALQNTSKMYMHTLSDMNYLKDFGIYKNTYLFTHGIKEFSTDTKKGARARSGSFFNTAAKTIATFGFLLPQKGILELVDITKQLHQMGHKVKLLLLTSIHPAPVSKQLEIQLKQKIQNSGISEYITLNTNFLSEDEIVSKLSQADKILFIYKDTQESSSAAVRMGLLSQKEVITTPVAIFDDVKTVTTQTKDNTLESICETIINSLNNIYDNNKQMNWCKENSWKNISTRFYNCLV